MRRVLAAFRSQRTTWVETEAVCSERKAVTSYRTPNDIKYRMGRDGEE
ncbi:MAG: hypothetical protein AB7U82_32795 [Blastocatellales bacterium]